MTSISALATCTWLARIVDQHSFSHNKERAPDRLDQPHPSGTNTVTDAIGQEIPPERQNRAISGQTGNNEGVRHFFGAFIDLDQSSSIFSVTNKDLAFCNRDRRN